MSHGTASPVPHLAVSVGVLAGRQGWVRMGRPKGRLNPRNAPPRGPEWFPSPRRTAAAAWTERCRHPIGALT
ncbi:hypothetical protein GCM10022420_046690 [Streptomyces iranensis]